MTPARYSLVRPLPEMVVEPRVCARVQIPSKSRPGVTYHVVLDWHPTWGWVGVRCFTGGFYAHPSTRTLCPAWSKSPKRADRLLRDHKPVCTHVRQAMRALKRHETTTTPSVGDL